MMDDTQDTSARPDSYRVTADELRQFIERMERLEAEKKDLAEQQKEVMAEAKSRGYDTKVIRKVPMKEFPRQAVLNAEKKRIEIALPILTRSSTSKDAA